MEWWRYCRESPNNDCDFPQRKSCHKKVGRIYANGSESALSRNQAEALKLVQIVIPTVDGREDFLRLCLTSIRSQPGGTDLEVLVSGNGTGAETLGIAASYGTEFRQISPQISAASHEVKIMENTNRDYVWIIGDDDHLADGAISEVLNTISNARLSGAPLSAIIGRAQSFSKDDFSDLGPPIPPEKDWKPGTYSDLDGIGQATLGAAHFGAFIFRADLFKVRNYKRYSGTSHELFGALWDGLSQASDPSTQVLDFALVHLRQAEKRWDFSEIRTIRGLRKYDTLLPNGIRETRLGIKRHLSRAKALRYASICSKSDRGVLLELVETFNSYSPVARFLARLPQPPARFLVRFFEIVRPTVYAMMRMKNGIMAAVSKPFVRSSGHLP